jgi:hypothetical protein
MSAGGGGEKVPGVGVGVRLPGGLQDVGVELRVLLARSGAVRGGWRLCLAQEVWAGDSVLSLAFLQV